MNKILIALAIFGFAVAYAQPAQNKGEMLDMLAMVERVVRTNFQI